MLVVRMVTLGLILGGAGCIQPTLTPCGDLDCPSGTTCLADRCVTSAQLAGCAGKTDGDGCAVGDKVGACDHGACAFRGCGNGVIDPGEVCDDGNTTFGDGCSADCRSLETCGNGVVDVALGEGCDCGSDAATRPMGCRLPNSTDPEAECTPDCKPRFCGDGAVDGLEQCDGAALGTATCADFGYYRGAPTCSSVCQLEVAGCAGRCGDGLVEPVFGEFCDGAPPTGTCLTYGYDAGYVGCSAACSTDVAHCERFGWVQLDAGDVKSLWANQTQALVVSATSQSGTNAWVVVNGIRELSPAGVYTLATGDSTHAYAIAADHVAVWSGTTWSTLAAGWTATTPSAAWTSPTLGLYVVVGGAVWRYASGAWVDQALTGVTGISGDGAEVFAWSTAQVKTSTGGLWVGESLPSGLGASTIDLFTRNSAGPSWLAAGQNLYRRDGSVWTFRNVYGRVTSGSADANGDLVGVLASSSVIRYFNKIGAAVSENLVNPGIARSVTVTPDGGLTFAGNTGAYRLRSGAWDTRDLIESCCAYQPYSGDRFSRIVVAANGFVTVLDGRGSYSNTGPWSGNDQQGFQPEVDSLYGISGILDVTSTSDGAEVYLDDAGITDQSGNLYFDKNIYDVDGNPISSYWLTAMRPVRNGDVLVSGVGVIVRATSSTSWQVIDTSGWNIYAIDEASAGAIVALAQDDGGTPTLLRIDGAGTITPVAIPGAPDLRDIWASPTGEAVLVGPGLVVRCPAMTCTSETVPANLFTIAGTASDDLFVGGAPTSSAFGALTRWDGARWYPVRTPGGNVYSLHVDDHDVYYVNGSKNVYTLPRVAKW